MFSCFSRSLYLDFCNYRSNLNINTVKEVLNMFRGCHDFSAFTKYTLRDPWKVTKRVIDEFEFYELPAYTYINDPQLSNITMWEFHVKSASFLYHQVNCILSSHYYYFLNINIAMIFIKYFYSMCVVFTGAFS